MKRIISLIAVLAMLTATLLTVAIHPFADDATEGESTSDKGYHITAAGLYDENLIAYYDFLGETADEQFADKAPAGSSDDNLTHTANVTVTDGVAYIPSTQGEYLSIDALDGDTADLVGKTLYIEYYATGYADTYATDLISANKIFRYWLAKGSKTDKYVFGGGIGATPTSADYKLIFQAGAAEKPQTTWYYTAISFEMTDDRLYISIYNSADGTEYVLDKNYFEGDQKPENLVRNVALLIGKNSPGVADRGLSFNVNQFRIYNTVLTADQVRNLSYITPGQATTTLPPAEGEDSTPDTPDPVLPERLPIAALYDEHLVAYYDFEGDSDAAKAHDKAPAGTLTDKMTFSNVVANNGVAYISSEQGSYISISKTGDAADLAGKTIYLTFNATGSAGTYANDLISASGTFRYWLNKGSGDDSFSFGGGISSTPTATGYKLTTNKDVPLAPVDMWYHLAITFELSETELKIAIYSSADGKAYVETVDYFVGENKPADLIRTTSMLLGKATTSVGDRGISYYIDQLRIYDTVLTADEIANLVYTVPGQATTLPEPPVTPPATDEPTPPVTNTPNPSETDTPTNEPESKPSTPAVTDPEAPTTQPSATQNGAETTQETSDSSIPEKKGCGATVTVPFAIIALGSTLGMIIIRKKEPATEEE